MAVHRKRWRKDCFRHRISTLPRDNRKEYQRKACDKMWVDVKRNLMNCKDDKEKGMKTKKVNQEGLLPIF
jgi:hypothetical protein